MRTLFLLPAVITLFALASCRKDAVNPVIPPPVSTADSTPVDHPSGGINGSVPIDSTPSESPFTTYVIPAGDHYCIGNAYVIDTFWGAHFQAIFDSSCIYTSADPSNQADINKLYGFSDSATHHQTNSARFGWNWQDGALRIYGYCYRSGIRESTEICAVSLNEPHDFRIELRAGQYFFAVDNKHYALLERAAQEPYAFGYSLLPYFGGDEVAPHEVRIKLKQL